MTPCPISRLTKPQLNAAVAHCLGLPYSVYGDVVWARAIWLQGDVIPVGTGYVFEPTSKGEHAWPLIDHDRISICYSDPEESPEVPAYCWCRSTGQEYDHEEALVAAMMAFVGKRHPQGFDLDLLGALPSADEQHA